MYLDSFQGLVISLSLRSTAGTVLHSYIISLPFDPYEYLTVAQESFQYEPLAVFYIASSGPYYHCPTARGLNISSQLSRN